MNEKKKENVAMTIEKIEERIDELLEQHDNALVSVKDFKEALGFEPGPHDYLFGIQFSED